MNHSCFSLACAYSGYSIILTSFEQIFVWNRVHWPWNDRYGAFLSSSLGDLSYESSKIESIIWSIYWPSSLCFDIVFHLPHIPLFFKKATAFYIFIGENHHPYRHQNILHPLGNSLFLKLQYGILRIPAWRSLQWLV